MVGDWCDRLDMPLPLPECVSREVDAVRAVAQHHRCLTRKPARTVFVAADSTLEGFGCILKVGDEYFAWASRFAHRQHTLPLCEFVGYANALLGALDFAPVAAILDADCMPALSWLRKRIARCAIVNRRVAYLNHLFEMASSVGTGRHLASEVHPADTLGRCGSVDSRARVWNPIDEPGLWRTQSPPLGGCFFRNADGRAALEMLLPCPRFPPLRPEISSFFPPIMGEPELLSWTPTRHWCGRVFHWRAGGTPTIIIDVPLPTLKYEPFLQAEFWRRTGPAKNRRALKRPA